MDNQDLVDRLSRELHERLEMEIEKILRDQFDKIGVPYNERDVKRFTYFPDDPLALALFKVGDKTILGVRIGKSGMSIEFDVPEIGDKTKGDDL